MAPETNRPLSRIDKRFRALKAEGRAGLVTFLTAGDPTPELSQEIINGLPGAGADLIEIGMPFSDPMADGPSIQASSLRAIKAGMTLARTLDMVAKFRETDDETPIVLMGYFNPIYSFGVETFLTTAKKAGVDGLIVVDVPPEEEDELCLPALNMGIDFIYLTAPTTHDARLPKVTARASGFVYFVSITGITGTKTASIADVAGHVGRIKKHTDLPVAVGFGLRTPDQLAAVAHVADAAVVGSALVDVVTDNLTEDGAPKAPLKKKLLALVEDLAGGIRGVAKSQAGGEAA